MRNTDNRDQQDDFDLEITDLPHEETHSIASAFVDLGARFLSRIRSLDVKVSWQAREEEEEDESFFDIRITDLPPDYDAI
jgi:hypothetical protein